MATVDETAAVMRVTKNAVYNRLIRNQIPGAKPTLCGWFIPDDFVEQYRGTMTLHEAIEYLSKRIPDVPTRTAMYNFMKGGFLAWFRDPAGIPRIPIAALDELFVIKPVKNPKRLLKRRKSRAKRKLRAARGRNESRAS
jgi:hypothetical protein